MILLSFMLGIALIFLLARYNESNKLFWTLLFSYLIGFAGTKLALQTTDGGRPSNEKFVQVYSTQPFATTITTLSYYTACNKLSADNVVTAQAAVSQSITPATNKLLVTESLILRRTRDQPHQKLIKPPTPWLQKVISTHRDYGLFVHSFEGHPQLHYGKLSRLAIYK